MNHILNNYLNPDYIYRFTHGPDVVRTPEEALREGINCISLVHLVAKELFNYELPAELKCREMFSDRNHFESVQHLGKTTTGDLGWFGVENPAVKLEDFVPRYQGGYLVNWPDYPIKHVAIFTGEHDETGDHNLLHASAVEGTNVVWPLRQFGQFPRYSKLYGITRLRAERAA